MATHRVLWIGRERWVDTHPTHCSYKRKRPTAFLRRLAAATNSQSNQTAAKTTQADIRYPRVAGASLKTKEATAQNVKNSFANRCLVMAVAKAERLQIL